MNGRRVSRLAAVFALAAALQLIALPLAAAGPPGPAAALRHESLIENIWSWFTRVWAGLSANWASDGGVVNPLDSPEPPGQEPSSDGGIVIDPSG